MDGEDIELLRTSNSKAAGGSRKFSERVVDTSSDTICVMNYEQFGDNVVKKRLKGNNLASRGRNDGAGEGGGGRRGVESDLSMLFKTWTSDVFLQPYV